MPVTSEEIFGLGMELSKLGNEVATRAAIGRQLISALQYPAETLPVPVRQRSRFLGAKLDILRIRRHWADYDIHESVKAGEPENQERVAAAVMEDCDRAC